LSVTKELLICITVPFPSPLITAPCSLPIIVSGLSIIILPLYTPLGSRMVEYGEAWLIASCRGLDSSVDMSKKVMIALLIIVLFLVLFFDICQLKAIFSHSKIKSENPKKML